MKTDKMKKNIIAKPKPTKKTAKTVNLKRKKPLKNDTAKPKKLKKSKEYSEMSVDDFMDKELERSSDEENDNSGSEALSDEEDNQNYEMKLDTNEENDEEQNSGSESDANEFESHKESLAKLKEIDPDFYKFLEENDKKLLQFNESDSEDEEKDENAEDDENVHKPGGELEVASDESDFEPDEEDAKPGDSRVITLKLLKTWQKDIQTDKSAKTINCLTKAFHAALIRVSNDADSSSEYKVDGSSVFNAVIQICVLELGPAIRRYLKLPAGSKQPAHKCKRFDKIKSMLRSYFVDLLQLLGGVTSTNILNVLLKHLHTMSPFIVTYVSVTKKMLKRLIHLWGTSDETVRVVAFMCILRITNNHQASYLDMVLKSMYMTYVKNCKFMSVGTLPGINFMRRSLTEMFALDVNFSYQHVFLYIRQLAIHLRSAVTLHKKENIQAVYNWQFINSIHLWANLLTITCNKPQLQPLIYPLVQVTIGTIKLLPTAQYFPLRFHCLQILTELSRDTNIFIPILPLLLEVLTIFDFNKKHNKVSMKPLQFTCLLRLSKSQMMENGFKDATIDTLYGLLLEYLASQSHSISFPDTTLFAVMQLKQFVKKCSVANYTKKLKQILEKIEQNAQFIENERKKITFEINNFRQIDAWETRIKNKGTPLNTFYESWNKLHNIKKQKQITNNDALAEYKLPELKKINKTIKPKTTEGAVELFPSSDSDSEAEVGLDTKQKQKRGKRGSGKNKQLNKTNGNHDVSDDDGVKDEVQDLKASDW